MGVILAAILAKYQIGNKVLEGARGTGKVWVLLNSRSGLWGRSLVRIEGKRKDAAKPFYWAVITS